VDSDGWLQISGPIATLRCRDDATFDSLRLEDDELTFTSVSGTNRSPIDARFANGAQNVLDAAALPFPVDIHTQLVALGLPTDKEASFDLLIERKGPGCGVQPASTTLFTVPVRVPGPPDRLVLASDGVLLKVFKVESTSTTEVFRFTRMADELQTPSNSLYLRNQNRMVVPIGYGWGIVNPAGVVEVTSTPDPDFGDFPAAVGPGGRYRVHTYNQHVCPDPESACYATWWLRLYDNATNALVEQFAMLAKWHSYGGLAVGPAGEVLYFDHGNGDPSSPPDAWHLRPADGGAARTIAVPYYPNGDPPRAAFSPAGDKAYFYSYPYKDIAEVDLATGATRNFAPPIGPSADFVAEAGGLIYWHWNSIPALDLIRFDLVTEQESVIAQTAFGGFLIP
jgi:hypothetical protein